MTLPFFLLALVDCTGSDPRYTDPPAEGEACDSEEDPGLYCFECEASPFWCDAGRWQRNRHCWCTPDESGVCEPTMVCK